MGLRNKKWHGAYARGYYQEKEEGELINPPGGRPSDFRRPLKKAQFLERIFDSFSWAAVIQDIGEKAPFMVPLGVLDTNRYNDYYKREKRDKPRKKDLEGRFMDFEWGYNIVAGDCIREREKSEKENRMAK